MKTRELVRGPAWRSRLEAVGALAFFSLLAACKLSSGNEPRTYQGTNQRADVALRTASEDLGCAVETMLIATTLERRFSNTSVARYVIEGCGERALYVEQCETSEQPSGEGFQPVLGGSPSFRCRYLMVSRVAIPSHSAEPARRPGSKKAAPPATTSTSTAPPTSTTPMSL